MEEWWIEENKVWNLLCRVLHIEAQYDCREKLREIVFIVLIDLQYSELGRSLISPTDSWIYHLSWKQEHEQKLRSTKMWYHPVSHICPLLTIRNYSSDIEFIILFLNHSYIFKNIYDFDKYCMSKKYITWYILLFFFWDIIHIP